LNDFLTSYISAKLKFSLRKQLVSYADVSLQSTDFPLWSSLQSMLSQVVHSQDSPALVTSTLLKLPRFLQLDEFRKYFQKVKITCSFNIF